MAFQGISKFTFRFDLLPEYRRLSLTLRIQVRIQHSQCTRCPLASWSKGIHLSLPLKNRLFCNLGYKSSTVADGSEDVFNGCIKGIMEVSSKFILRKGGKFGK